MRVLVCGGRKYSNYTHVRETLDKLHAETPFSLVIHGGAKGADTLAGIWAQESGVHFAAVPALWDFYDKEAGHRRNTAMLNLDPELVVAFPGGPGTANMVRQAMGRRIKVISVPEAVSAPEVPF